MNRGFPQHWGGFPGRGRGHWFHPDYMQNEEFWRDGPALGWNQWHPELERVCNSGNYNFRGSGWFRGYFHERRPYRGLPYRGPQGSFFKGSFQKTSPSFLTPSKKENNSKKVEDQPSASKQTKQEEEEPAPLVNEPEPPKVSEEASRTTTSPQKLSLPTDCSAVSESKEDMLPRKKEKDEVQVKESQVSEDHSNQTTLDTTPVEKQTIPGTTEGLPTIENEEPLLVPENKQDMNLSSLTDSSWATEPVVPPETEETIPSLERDKLTDMQVYENPPSLITPLPSPEEPTKEQTLPETPEGLLYPTKPEDSGMLEANCSSHASTPLSVEIPFLSKTPEDHQCEEKKEIDQTQSSDCCEGVDHHQACVAPTINTSSLSSTFSEIHCVPVLVRRSKIELPYSWESASFCEQNLSGWAPEDYQEPPWGIKQSVRCDKVFDCDRDSVSSQSLPWALISCTPKCETGKLMEHHSCSLKRHHSTDSKHSSASSAPRELRIQRVRCPHRQASSSRSPHRQEPRSRSSHRRFSRSPNRRHHRSLFSFKREHSPQRQGQSSRSPSRRRKDFGRSYGHYRHGCNPSQEHSRETGSPCPYRTHELDGQHPPRERSKTYEGPYSCSLESPTEACKTNVQKAKKKISMQPKRSERKRTTSEKVTKSTKIKKKARLSPCAVKGTIPSETTQNLQPLRTEEPEKIAASKEAMGSPYHPSAGKKDSFLALSWTPEERSAAVLARKEEIEQAYLQVLLNFAAVAIMLVEKEPCMEKTMESALRANLRKIGDYYECLLKNYIDSLAEAS
ncbi:muscle M-line assembly protein unc-89-like isoform X2 [Varanus komodoensis]|uniref:muscle M-line assembly protein unc-89-like isoform X2 n=1 Tax=Varanus komodoensis TaxID=61221 RepID=UPI001CF7B06B|nr:muscle M-line assembly protein unc-89-like isoform X2 [Varanus komodoensis]